MSNKSNWVFIAILTFCLAIVWAGVTAYSQIKKTTISPDVQQIMEPLDPNLNIETLQKIKERSK